MQGSASKNQNKNQKGESPKNEKVTEGKDDKSQKVRQNKTRQSNFHQDKPRQNEVHQSGSHQNETSQNRSSQNETRQSVTSRRKSGKSTKSTKPAKSKKLAKPQKPQAGRPRYSNPYYGGSRRKNTRRKNKARRRKSHGKYKKYQDRRFRKNEGLIFDICFDTEEVLSVKKFTRKTGISKTTFYRHHKGMHIIQADYEDYILWKFSCALKEFKSCCPREVFRRTLYFMITHRRLFKVFPKKRGDEALRGMVYKLKPKILAQAPMREIVFRIYADEVAEILKGWAKCGCKESEIEKVLYNIMYLTNSANIRLGPLKD